MLIVIRTEKMLIMLNLITNNNYQVLNISQAIRWSCGTHNNRLPLLPSGPGGIYSILLHRAQRPDRILALSDQLSAISKKIKRKILKNIFFFLLRADR